jgi:hypothetical protein
MKTNRILLFVLVALSVAVVALCVRVVQLRRQVKHAELYVEAGVQNWGLACSRVADLLRTLGGDYEASMALHDVAHACIGRSDYVDTAAASAIAGDFNAKDVNGLVRRIEHAVETRDYFLPAGDTVTGRFPKGY